MTHQFSIEHLAAFLLGVADQDDRDAIASELEVNQELRAELALMGRLIDFENDAAFDAPADPSVGSAKDHTNGDPKTSANETAEEATLAMDGEETALPLGASPKYLRPLPNGLEEVAQLDEQGLDVKEIADRVQMTKTLTALKLRHLSKFRS